MRNHSLSFLIPTRMRRHVRSFHHVVEVVDWHFPADDVSSKRRLSLPVFSAYKEGKPGRQVCTMPGLSRESRGRRVFGRGVADATLVGWRTCFTLFFRSHRRERLAQLTFGELIRGRLWEWQRCERAVCHAIQSFFLEKTMTNKGCLCCDRELKKLQSVRQRRDEPQGLEPLQDGWWKCFIHNEATNLRDPTGAVERTLSI